MLDLEKCFAPDNAPSNTSSAAEITMEGNEHYCQLRNIVLNLINRFVPGCEPDLTVRIGKSKLEIKCHKQILTKSPVIKSWIAKSKKILEIIRADEIIFLHIIAILYSGKPIWHQQHKPCIYVDLMVAYIELSSYTPDPKRLHLLLDKNTGQIIEEALQVGSTRPDIVPCILQCICRSKHNSVEGTIAVEKGGRNGKPRVVLGKYGLGDPILVTVHQRRGLSLNCLQHFCVDHRGVTLISYDVHTIVIKCPLGNIDTILCGWIQIAWPGVHLVICNPSGITIDDVTLHNARRLTLTTGEVTLKHGILKFFVTDGTVTICGRGIDLQSLRNVSIFSKNFVAGATIATSNLKIVTGKNIVEVSGDDDIDIVEVKRFDDNPSTVASPEFQIHHGVSISSNEMMLVVNGCANNDGTIIAANLDYSVTGNFKNGKGGSICSFQSSLFNISQKWNNYGTVFSEKKVTIKTGTFENYEDSKIVAPVINMQSEKFTSQGILRGTLTMDTTLFNLGPSSIADCKSVDIIAQIVENEGKINSETRIDIKASDITNYNGGQIVAKDVKIVCTSMENARGASLSTRTLEVEQNRQYSQFKNEGTISAELKSRINTVVFTNSQFGHIESADLKIRCIEECTTSGKIRAFNLVIQSPTLDILAGLVEASETNFEATKMLNKSNLVHNQLDISTESLQNHGSIQTGRGVINATEFINYADGSLSSADITINCTDNCTTSGKVQSGNIDITAPIFEVVAGSVEADRTKITARDVCNKASMLQNHLNISTYRLQNSGTIVVRIGSIKSEDFVNNSAIIVENFSFQSNRFENSTGSIISAEKSVDITANMVDNEGKMNSESRMEIKATDIRNYNAGQIVAKDLRIVSTSVTNDSIFKAQSSIKMLIDKIVCSMGSQISSPLVSIKAKDFIQTDGQFFGGMLELITSAFENNANGNIAVEHIRIYNEKSTADHSKDLEMTTVVKNSGHIKVKKSLNIQARQLYTANGSHTECDDEIVLDTHECINSGHTASINKITIYSDMIKNLLNGLVLTNNLQICSSERGCVINFGEIIALSIESVFSTSHQSKGTISEAEAIGFFNRGRMRADVIKLSGNKMENERGATVSTRTLEVEQSRQHSQFKNEGTIGAELNSSINTAVFTNSQFGHIESADLKICCGEECTTSGKIRALNLLIQAPILDILAGSVEASKTNFKATKMLNKSNLVHNQLDISTESLHNYGSIETGRGSINATQFINSTDNSLSSADVSINCTDNCTTSGKVRAGNIQIIAPIFEVMAGSMEAERTKITSRYVCNKANVMQNHLNISTYNFQNSGSIEAKSGSINSQEFVNNSAINVENLSIQSNRFENNTGSRMYAEKAIIQSSSVFENSGNINAEVSSIITNTFNNNRGGTVEGASVTFDCNASIYNNGSISADSKLVLKSKEYYQSPQSVTSSGCDMSLHLNNLTNPATIKADNNLDLFVQNIENHATIASRNGTVSVVSNSFGNDGIIVGQNTKIASNGNLTNKGTLRATGCSSLLELSSDTIDNIDGGVITATTTKIAGNTNNAGLIHGTEVCSLVCGSVKNNNGALINGGVLKLECQHVENPINGVIAARIGILAKVDSFANSESALVYSSGYFNISGLSSTKASTITNTGAIDIQGDASLCVNNFRQRNSNFSTAEVLVTEVHITENRPPNQQNYTFYDFIRTIYETRIASTSPATLYVGGSLHLDTDSVENDKSRILAGQIIGRIDSIQNCDHHGNRTITELGKSRSTWVVTARTGRRKHLNLVGPRKRQTTRHWSSFRSHFDRRLEPISLNAVLSETRTPPSLGSDTTVATYQTRHDANGKYYTVVDHGRSQRRPSVRTISYKGFTLDISTLINKSLYSVIGNHCQQYSTATHVPAPFICLDSRLVTDATKTLEKCLALPSSSMLNLPRGDLSFEKKLVRDQVLQLTGKTLLPHFSSEDDQISALTMNGRRIKGLTIGAELTNKQIDSLEQNILWMVKMNVKLPDGNTIQALIPQVYIVSTTTQPDILMDVPNCVISANRIDLNVMDSFVNDGLCSANDINLNVNTILNRRGMITADSMNISAKNDITNESGIIIADKLLKLNAGRDLNVITKTQSPSCCGTTVERTELGPIATVFVQSSDGELNLKAGRDVNIRAARVENAGIQSTISADNDINFTSAKVVENENKVWDTDSRISKEQTRDIGSLVKVSGNLYCKAARDINATATCISAGVSSDSLRSIDRESNENIARDFSRDLTGKLELDAGRNINLLSGVATHNLDEEHTSQYEFTFDDMTVHTRNQLEERHALGSTLVGNNISAVAGQDFLSKGTAIQAVANIHVKTGNNMVLDCAESTALLNSMRYEEKDSLFSNVSTLANIQKGVTTNLSTTMECMNGDVILNAGGSYRQSGSQVHSKEENIIIDASEVAIVDSQNKMHLDQQLETEEFGFVFGASSSINDAVNTFESMESDIPLTCVTAGLAVVNTLETVIANPKVLGGFNLSVKFGTSRFNCRQTGKNAKTQPSIVQANRNVCVRSRKDNVELKGSHINAHVVNVDSANDVNILAGFDENENQCKTTSRSTMIGFSAAVESQTGCNINLQHSSSRGRGKCSGRQVFNASIQGHRKIKIKSARDTNVAGGKIASSRVNMKVGRNFSIKSVQDSETITQTSNQVGFGLSYQVGSSNIVGSIQKSTKKVNSNYRAVNERTAIISDTFNINVGGNTHLEGADIVALNTDSSLLSTKSLTESVIENTSNFSVQQNSIGISCGMSLKSSLPNGTKRCTLSAAPPYVSSLSENDHSVTTSHVSNARHTVQIGNTQPHTAQLLTKLAETSSEAPLANRFDQEKIQKQMAAASSFSQELNKFVYNRARSIDKAEMEAAYLEKEADDMDNTLNPEERSALLKRVDQLKISASKDKHIWGVGGVGRQLCLAAGAAATSTSSLNGFVLSAATHFTQQKVAQEIGEMVNKGILQEGHPLHVGVHAMTAMVGAGLRGEDCTASAMGAAASTLIPRFLGNVNPKMLETESLSDRNLVCTAVVGVASLLGTNSNLSSVSTSAMIAAENNWLSSRQRVQYMQELAAASTFLEKVKIAGRWATLSGRQNYFLTNGFINGLLKGWIGDIEGVALILAHPFKAIRGIKELLCNHAVRAEMGSALLLSLESKVKKIEFALINGEGNLDAERLGEDFGELIYHIGTTCMGVFGLARGAMKMTKAGFNFGQKTLRSVKSLNTTHVEKCLDIVAGPWDPANNVLQRIQLSKYRGYQTQGKAAFGEIMGERYIGSKFSHLGRVKQIALKQGPGHKGIDAIFEVGNGPNAKHLVVEYKFGTSQLNLTKHGKQMSDTWVRHRLLKALSNDSVMADKLLLDLNSGKIAKLLVRVNAAGEIKLQVLDKYARKIKNVSLPF